MDGNEPKIFGVDIGTITRILIRVEMVDQEKHASLENTVIILLI